MIELEKRFIGTRPKRAHTYTCVVHKFNVGEGPDDTEKFFLRDPEGVATVCLKGAWKKKLPVFSSWWVWEDVPPHWYQLLYGYPYPKAEFRDRLRTQIPPGYIGHVPYHYEIHDKGIRQHQPFEAQTSHAAGENTTGAAVAVRGELTEEKGQRLRELLQAIEDKHGPGLKFMGHDESNILHHIKPKGCPGFDLGPYRPKQRSLLGA